MSTLQEREQLIQRRLAEKYLNVIRLAVLAIVTGGLAFRGLGAPDGSAGPSVVLPLVVGAAWLYALIVQAAVSRSFVPRPLAWVTTLVDLTFVTLGLWVGWQPQALGAGALATDLNWGYSLLFLLILFSTLRERPGLTLATGVGSAGVYGLFLALDFPGKPMVGFWEDQAFRTAFLLLAGLFSSFHARSIHKAFVRLATSDQLHRDLAARLKVLAIHFPGVLFQAEVSGRRFHVRYVSEGSRALLGMEPRDLMAHPQRFFDRVPPPVLRGLLDRVSADLGRGGTWDEEFLFVRDPDRALWLKLVMSAQRTPRGSLVINGLVTDTTVQRQTAEALREANQAKTDFLATMSHELRTPLNAILGNADQLSRLAVTDEDQRAFRDLQSSGDTLLGLIEDILVFSRLEAGRLVPEIRLFPWRSQVEAVVESFRSQAQAKGLDLVVQFPEKAPARIGSDGLRVRQIVANLVGNAVKFTPSGSVVVRVTVEPQAFEVSVTDTGIGIPGDSLEKIFEKFTQGEQGKSRTYGGLGLGLSISRSLAELLGGTLTVESRWGEGSVFRLRIPIQGTGDAEPLGLAEPQGDEKRPPARILLVEDNPTNRDVETRMLQRLGAEVDLAPGGFEAVQIASQRFYDLIFMDWQMPGMDGREATAKIRSLPSGQDLVIVALSGHALPGDRELLLASGFDDYLSKPVRMDDFRAILAKWVTVPRSPS